MRAIVLGVSILLAEPAMAADQFDLVCTSKSEDWHYRVDLGRGEFCADECKVINKIASVTSGTITLTDQKPVAGGDEIRNQINRSTGEWTYFRNLSTIHYTKYLSGTCRPVPFSGFPEPKF